MNILSLSLEKKAEIVRQEIGIEGGGRKAEKALEIIARSEGDAGLIQIMDQLSSLELSAIICEHDLSCESLIAGLVTPERFAQMLEAHPASWEKITEESIFKLQDEALNLLTSVLLGTDNEKRQGELLDAINSEARFLYLLLPLIGWEYSRDKIDIQYGADEEKPIDVEGEVSRFLENPSVEAGSASALFAMIRNVRPEIAEKILSYLKSEENFSEDSEESFLFSTLVCVYEQAQTRINKKPERISDEMFLPLD